MKRIFPVAVTSVLVLAASEVPASADESKPIPPIPIAHRGLLRHAPENTLPAFAACLELGMGFELDIRTTKDGNLVVLHDDNVQRATDGPLRSVRDMTLREVKRLDAGSWFDKAYTGVRVPTLEETLSLVSQRKHGPTIIALNVKDVTRKGETQLVALVKKYSLLSESFAFDQRDEMSRRLKKLNLAFRIGQNVSRQSIEARLNEGLLDCFLLTSTPKTDEVRRLHNHGKQVLIVLQVPPAVHAAETDAWEKEIAARRTEYVDWVIEHFGNLEPDMKPLDGRAWSLNQARLFLDRDTDKASRYFETVKLTIDPDFMGIRLLKTLLDFGETDRLSNRAREHLTQIIRDWPMDRKGGISRAAFWPPRFTENHDLMHLTIGLFSEQLRGQPTKSHLNELKRSLSWRFERGFYEWGSHRYQLHYSNPLFVLAIHAPDPDICRGAADLFNIMFAERALMSVGGYLGGPGMRSYGRNRRL